jgi:hypothetical protein
MNTAPNETSPWVMSGNHIVKLTIDGKVHEQSITIKMDPRVKTSADELKLQHDLSLQCYMGRIESMKALEEISSYRSSIKNSADFSNKDNALKNLEVTPQGSTAPSFGRLNNGFESAFNALQESDMPPTTQMINAVKELNQQLIVLKKKWETLRK